MVSLSPKRPPCVEHGLATGPDGRCALCRRASTPAHVPVPPAAGDGSGSRLLTRVLGLGLVLAAAGFAVFALQSSYGVLAPAPPPSRGAAPHPAEPRDPAAERARKKEPPKQPAAEAKKPESEPPAPEQPRPLTAEEQERRRLAELETAEQDRRRSEQIEADIAARALKRARADITVTLYATTWCPACKSAREYMTTEGIAYVERDIEASPSSRAIMRRLNPKGSVPTMDIDGEVLVGFSGDKIQSALDNAAKKRARL